jgi:Protein of unknown function (DUF1566)
MTTSQCFIAALLVSAGAATMAGPAAPHDRARLNDTGATRCIDADGIVLASCAGTGQDGEFGRDVTHNDPSDGIAGFRFRRVCNSGEYAGNGSCPAEPVLGPAADDWACTADMVTGFIWEVKTTDGGLRDMNKAYTNDDTLARGTATDLTGYIPAVNATGLCGASDWRAPIDNELMSIVNFNTRAPGPMIGWNFFPNTVAGPYWSSTVSGRIGGLVEGARLLRRPPFWATSFATAEYVPMDTYMQAHARLVRTAARPIAPRFVVSADEEVVTDTWTRLEWRACVEGRTLVAGTGTCAGTALLTDWAGALAAANAAGNGWRLPNIKELNSLTDREQFVPPTLAYTFGDKAPYTLPSYRWWSSTPVTGGGGAAWAIEFSAGFMEDVLADTGVVRLVRNAP